MTTLLFSLQYPYFTNTEIKKISHSNSINKNRIIDYQQKIQKIKVLSKKKQLEQINLYLNTLLPQYDTTINNQEDFWETPKEFLEKGYGDCEDYAIIKYYSLIKLGFDEKKLFLTIVKDHYSGGYHMVLSYFKTKKSIPLILDNLSFKILPLQRRKDLSALLFINSTGVYELQSNHLKKVASHYKKFTDLQQKVLHNL